MNRFGIEFWIRIVQSETNELQAALKLKLVWCNSVEDSMDMTSSMYNPFILIIYWR